MVEGSREASLSQSELTCFQRRQGATQPLEGLRLVGGWGQPGRCEGGATFPNNYGSGPGQDTTSGTHADPWDIIQKAQGEGSPTRKVK